MQGIMILTFCVYFTYARISKKHIQNSVYPNYAVIPTYDITEWVANLHLQLCTLVEIGENYCALFLEDLSSVNNTLNFFLGICDIITLNKWRLCAPNLEMQRNEECLMNFNSTLYNRVHRRFCDIGNIILTQPRCNCTNMIDRKVYCVTGFPTCFLDPLPESLCGMFNACGVSKCNATTVLGRIHSVQCDSNCIGRQPFCEFPVGAITSLRPRVTSRWSDWVEVERNTIPNTETKILHFEASCINKFTGSGAVDCLGPGTSCCPSDVLSCKCKTYLEDATLKVRRLVSIHIENLTTNFKDYIISEDMVGNKVISRLLEKTKLGRRRRIVRDTEYYEDENEDEDEGEEDIAIIEDQDNEPTLPQTEELEKDEIYKQQMGEILKPHNISDDAKTMDVKQKMNTCCIFYLSNMLCLLYTFFLIICVGT